MSYSRLKPHSMLGRHLDGVSGVYILIDPRTKIPMYAGQSINIGLRYRNHCNPEEWQNNAPKSSWIYELEKLDLVPLIEVVQECGFPEMEKVERETIRRYQEIGQCEFNVNLRPTDNPRGKTGPVSRDDWVQIGRKLKIAAALLWEVQRDVRAILGTKSDTKFKHIDSNIASIKCYLDSEVCERYPDWQEAIHVFYGREDGLTDGLQKGNNS